MGGCRPRGHRLHFGVHYNHCTRRQTLFSLCSFLTLPWNIFFLFMASACLFSVGHRSRKYEKLSHLHFYWFSTYSFRFLATKYFRYKITECELPGSTFIKDRRTLNTEEASLGSQPQNYREQHKMDKQNKFQSLKVDSLSLVVPAESDSAAKKKPTLMALQISAVVVSTFSTRIIQLQLLLKHIWRRVIEIVAWNLKIIPTLPSRRNFSPFSHDGHDQTHKRSVATLNKF